MGELATKVKSIIRSVRKPGWKHNNVLINQLKQQIEDEIFEFLDANDIELSMDQMDRIEDDILTTAKSNL